MSLNTLKTSWGKLSAIAVLFLGMSYQQALAHAHLKSQLPAEGAAIEQAQAPKVITLDFSEGIELAFSKIKVTNSDGKEITVGKLTLDPVNNTKLLLPLESDLSEGDYLVNWNVVSVDGHKTKGSYQFSVK
ncbi:copper homeostasis periplasmic binding protein CopC [Proteus faecis]|uniref:Copper resistance protein C n=1 Tax=Proteus faecis TaxID=2050967 RepID=A0AAW7CPP5_9GAMM|nr:copper homeostasis periplasmic binding protein CopC [Proteus faecis]MBG3011984.1 copper homeostasis periplasmic binding protein CopC [Proteus mirabilis]MCT8247940.1 copper homeostasis periplasmic binding protein CopC [Proteus faecis]MDL5166023.1 copper homeostasis periplasmic binding protein CopC [Proteus faecis]MDL5273713.1 copper homeostasis periplasmic binding protein CopC [Proteus faecis]MDL5277283.1 copper homeostasis periplasmic binding protein CopC [Proteus faecis]